MEEEEEEEDSIRKCKQTNRKICAWVLCTQQQTRLWRLLLAIVQKRFPKMTNHYWERLTFERS